MTVIIRQYDFNVSTQTDDAPVATGGFHIPTGTTAQRPTGAAGLIRHNITTQQFEGHNGTDWGDIGGGSGAGSRNYLSAWFDGAKSVGTVTNSITATGNITPASTWKASDTSKLTVANAATGGLRETKSLKLDHVAVGAGFVQTPEFALDTMDLGKPVSVSFDHGAVTAADDYQVYMVRYNSSGTYQEQIAIAGTASATSPYSAQLSASSVVKFQGFFIAGSTSTDLYALRFYRNNASDTTDVLVDSLYVGPNQVVQGAAITDWVDYTPATGAWATNCTYTGKWRRVGDMMQCQQKVAVTGATSGILTLSIPTGYTIDTSKLISSLADFVQVGNGIASDAGATPYKLIVCYKTTTTVSILYQNAASGSMAYVTQAAPITFANTDFVEVNFTIPIVGWSSNVTMANRAVEEYASVGGTWDAASSTTVYGSTGSLMGGALTAARVKTITWQSSILPTDSFIVEGATDPSGSWLPLDGFTDNSAFTIVRSLSTAGSASTSGGYAIYPGATSNQTRILFFRYAAIANDDLPSTEWPSTLYWRVRKVSGGGAAVGYPISTANIVGRSVGATVGSGYLGQKLDFTSRTVAAVTSGYTAHASALTTLTAGVWLILPKVSAVGAASATMAEFVISSNSSNDSTGNIDPASSTPSIYTGAAVGTWSIGGIPFVYIATTDTPIYGKAIRYGANSNAIISGCAVRIA